MNHSKAVFRSCAHFKIAVTVLIGVCTLVLSSFFAFAGIPPSDWQVTGLGRGGVLVNDATVEYDAGTWNIKTGRSRSAIVCKSLNDDISVVMKLVDGSGTGNSHIGIMMWSSLAPTAGKAGLVADPQGQKIYFSWDETSDRGSFYANYMQCEGVGFPVWLKLTRSGSYFLAFYSKDGTEWRPVGVPIKTFWAGKRPEIFAGAYADGVCEERVSDLKITPAPAMTLPPVMPDNWSMDVHGEPEFAGTATSDNGSWTLTGGSTRGRGGFHNVTVTKPIESKVLFSAKIRTADLADPRSGGGLLLSAHGIDAGLLVFPAGGKLMLFTRRNSDGRFLQYKNFPLPSTMAGQAEAMLGIGVADGQVAAYQGTSTNDWTQVGDTLTVNEMAADVSGGMELYTDSGSRLVSSVGFDDIQTAAISYLPGHEPPPAPAAQVAAAPPTTPSAQTPAQQTPRPVAPVYYPPQRSSDHGLGGLIFLLIVILVIATVILIKPFNRLVYLRNRTRKAWAQIDVQLKRRHDLILNYVEAVKGYAKHESGTLEGVTRARAAAANASTVEEHAKAEAALNATMRSLYAVVEAYPELKANQNFLSLQQNLTDTEDKLANARNEYNEEVMTYNTAVQSVPTNIVAMIFRFKERDFFEVKELDQREAPRAGI